MARQRFSLAACASSRGSYVARAHEWYIRQQHETIKEVIVTMCKPRFYARCWDKLIPITETQAAMLKRTGAVVIQ